MAAWIVPLFYLPGASYIAHALSSEWTWYWWDVFTIYYGHAIFFIAILVIARIVGVKWDRLFGEDPTVAEVIPALKLTCFIFLFSAAAAYALFIPLSYVSPAFVQWWYLDALGVILSDSGGYPILANVLNFLSLVVIAPVLEEVVFRGLLLHRWAYKWNLKTAIIVSSLLFGVMHADPIGAFVFGVGMCILYLRSQSLYIPILCHSLNNLAVWILEAGYKYAEGPESEYTLDAFRSEWYIGLICGAVVIIWAAFFLRNTKQLRAWKLPAI